MRALLTLLLIPVLAFAIAPRASAKVISGEGEVTVAANEVVSDDLFVAGQTVRIEGKIEGDLYAAAEYLYVTGVVNGDIVGAATAVEVSGIVEDDAYLFGRTVNLSHAKIGDTLHIASMDTSISRDTLLSGSLLAAGQTITNDATIPRNLMVAAADLRHNAPVLGEARLAGNKLKLGPDTRVERDLIYILSPEEGKLDSQAMVKGETRLVTPPESWQRQKQIDEQKKQNFRRYYALYSFIAMLIVSSVLVLISKRWLSGGSDYILKRPLRSFGMGLLLVFVTPAALLFLSLTLVGLPLALIIFGVYLMLLYLGKIVSSLAIGRAILRGFNLSPLSVLAELTLGLVLYHLARLIPVTGFFVSLIMTSLGLGAIYLTLRKGK